MRSWNELAWHDYALESLFKITATSSGIDRCRLIEGEGKYPYITRTEHENGWDGFVCEQPTPAISDSNNVITVGLDTQTAFYQPIPFYTGQNIQVFSSDKLNKYIALFVIPLLKKQMKKFNWGGNGATLTRLKRLRIMLPMAESGNPDYEFMEEYMREVEQRFLTRYKSYLDTKEQNTDSLNENKPTWKSFILNEIFDLSSSIRLTKEDMISGNRPFIGASDSNNGITAFVSNTNSSLDRNVLGVNYNGSVVENFYHPYEAIFSDDVKRLHLKNHKDNKYILLFIKVSILKQKTKFEYGYKFNGERMTRQHIMLPSNEDGTPNFDYMEQKMQLIEKHQLQKYIATRLKSDS